jgi:hypothetical protein
MNVFCRMMVLKQLQVGVHQSSLTTGINGLFLLDTQIAGAHFNDIFGEV